MYVCINITMPKYINTFALTLKIIMHGKSSFTCRLI